jgi:benzoyl-CoA reductase/2-hydroxyglutaryl-CoA dehydratase subunit BcrC/BadD/HgdB
LETKIRSEAFQKFAEATGSIMNPELQAWKDEGGKVVGFFCSTVPEELFTAAGLLPFRMRGTGSTSTELSDAFFSPINCSFPRHTFNQALSGEYDFLDGLICINSCDHVRRIYDNWISNLDTPFVQIMSLPRKVQQPQIDWYYDELNIMKEQLEKHFGVEISDERVREAIGLHNGIRGLQKRLYELRKADKPPITGTETLAVMVAGTAMPRSRYKELLEELLAELSQSEGSGDYRARLMIVGGELDDPEYIRIIEEQGGLVVADSTCFGSRLMWRPVDEEEPDPIRALARYYIYDRPSCPRMYGDQERRIAYTRELAKEFKVDGIIGERLLFCDMWVVEHYMTGLDLKEDGIPFMPLDREYISSGAGQLRTRVQAFLETLEGIRE